MVLDRRQYDRAELEAVLRRAGADKPERKTFRCPFHDDKHPSASIFRGDDGIWRFKCFTCDISGDMFDMIDRVDGAEGSFRKATKQDDPPEYIEPLELIENSYPNREITYKYVDPITRQIDLAVIRYRLNGDGRKAFVQCTPVGDRGFVRKGLKGKRPIYNRTRIGWSEKVLLVEGEKCVHALDGIGLIATTSPGGAFSARLADWRPLAGKIVYVWPDNDQPGKKYADEAIDCLRLLDPKPKIFRVDVPNLGLPEHGDIVELLASLPEGLAPEEQKLAVEAVLEDAQPANDIDALEQYLEDVFSGKVKLLRWPWTCTSKLARTFYPGTITMFCGSPGAAKSFALLDAVRHWQDEGHKVKLYELEENLKFWQLRALGQISGNIHVTDLEWLRANQAEARALYQQHKDRLDSLSECIKTAPDHQVALSELAMWIEEEAAKCDVLVVDPITMTKPTPNPWISDLEFLIRVKATIRRTGTCVVLATHPRTGVKHATGWDNMAGGSAYGKFVQSILWLQKHSPEETSKVKTAFGPTEVEHDITMVITKARNGPGQGTGVAMSLDRDSLCLREHGAIVKEKRRR